MDGIFPSGAEIEAELDRLQAERAALDAAIAERQLFIELGRRLAEQRRGQGGRTAVAAAPVVDGAADGLRAAPSGTHLSDGASPPQDASREAARSGATEATPPHSTPIAGAGSALTPRTEARARGRELVAEAVAILRAQGRPMHAAELVPRLAERGHVLPGRDPVAALNTRLWKRARTGCQVVRHGDAVYAAGEALADDRD